MLVSSLQTIRDRGEKFDAEVEGFYADMKTRHPDHDIAHIHPQRQSDQGTGERCDCCGAAHMMAWDLSLERFEPCCKHCINAIKLRGLKHLETPNRICIECHVDMDAKGWIFRAYHVYKSIGPEDITPDPATGEARQYRGLQADIDAGVVEIDDALGALIINGETIKVRPKKGSMLWRGSFPSEFTNVDGVIIPAGVPIDGRQVTPGMVAAPFPSSFFGAA